MQRSESIAKVAAALAGAQADLDNVPKDATNPHFRSQYATLPAILDAVRPVLAKHGLAVVQFPCDDGQGRVGVETILLHTSGEYLSHAYMARTQKDDPQGAGSAITYARRYALAAVLAIGQEDDDGNAASRGREPQRPAQATTPREAKAAAESYTRAAEPVPQARPGVRAISEAQAKRLWAIVYKEAELTGLTREQVEEIARSMIGPDGTKGIALGDYEPLIGRLQTAIRGQAPGGDPAGAFE